MAICDPLSWLSCICLEGLMELSKEALVAAADRAEKCPEIFGTVSLMCFFHADEPREDKKDWDHVFESDDGRW